jgi:hypothetical protein
MRRGASLCGCGQAASDNSDVKKYAFLFEELVCHSEEHASADALKYEEARFYWSNTCAAPPNLARYNDNIIVHKGDLIYTLIVKGCYSITRYLLVTSSNVALRERGERYGVLWRYSVNKNELLRTVPFLSLSLHVSE